MKILSVNLGTTNIEFDNSIWGEETIYVNGEFVSSKHSWFGTTHTFEVEEEGIIAAYKLITGTGTYLGLAVDLIRNEIPIIETTKAGWQSYFFLVLFIAILL